MSVQPQSIDIHNTFGAAFIGVVAASLLYGVTCSQAWFYFIYQRDTWPLKVIVGSVMFFDTLHQILISHTIYTYLIIHYNNPVALNALVWSGMVEVAINGCTVLLVQGFMTMRVWYVTNKNIWLTCTVALLVLAEFSLIVVYSVLTLSIGTFVALEEAKFLQLSINVLAAAGDVVITVTLCICLYRSQKEFPRSRAMINRLMSFIVNTGALTSLCALGSLISSLAAPMTFWYITFFFCIGRLYANSLLASLNCRQLIRDPGDGAESFHWQPEASSRNTTGIVSSRIATKVSVRMETMRRSIEPKQEPDVDPNGAPRSTSLSIKGRSSGIYFVEKPPIEIEYEPAL